jgi:midasin (ATPase involved in ribosome maturation)
MQITSLEEAMKKLPSSVVPIEGLRRDNDGNLTADALRTITDGLKSRGIDPTDPTVQEKLQQDLTSFLCSLNNQYNVLMKELLRKVSTKEKPSKEFIEIIKDKNITMQDVINVSRHLGGVQSSTQWMTFMEGWQNTESVINKKGDKDALLSLLKEEFQTLSGSSADYMNVQKRMVEVTEEKNKIAYNYLGLYGFLNIIAIGLLIFIAAGPTKR